jgi:hypothetical protein
MEIEEEDTNVDEEKEVEEDEEKEGIACNSKILLYF